jgi:hypothetical protein
MLANFYLLDTMGPKRFNSNKNIVKNYMSNRKDWFRDFLSSQNKFA